MNPRREERYIIDSFTGFRLNLMIMIMEDDNNDIFVEVEIPSYLYDTDYDDVNWNDMPDEDDEEFDTFCD